MKKTLALSGSSRILRDKRELLLLIAHDGQAARA